MVGQAPYRERSAALAGHAVRLASDLRPDGMPPAAPAASAAVLGVFRRRIIPDLLIDVTAIRGMLGVSGPNNPLDLG